MSIEEENKAVIQRFVDELNKGNLAVMDESLADNFVRTAINQPDMDKEGYKQFIAMLNNAFPDIQCTIVDVVAEGDKVAYRTSITGTHKGNLMGIAPTGKQFKITEDYFSRFEGGKIVEHNNLADMLSYYQQLGINPPSQ
jgi:steroid delta-isomerase-like uncharacterized protein